MTEEVNKLLGNVTIKNRESLEIDNVENISSFDEEYLSLNSKLGKIIIEGHHLRVEDLNRETGKIRISGTVDAVVFSDERKRPRKGLFS